MVEVSKWKKNTSTHAFLVALDISGFSIDINPNQLANHRMNFFHSIEESPLFASASHQDAVKVHFLGDELRIAFHTMFKAGEIKSFIEDIFARLEDINSLLHVQHQTRIRGVVLRGEVIWQDWHNCDYFDGTLAIKAQDWMSYLHPCEIAIDENFKQSLEVDGVASILPTKEFIGELGYLLKKEV